MRSPSDFCSAGARDAEDRRDERAMDAKAAALRRIEGWSVGWARHDPEPIAALYSDNAFFRSSPFRVPARGPDGARIYARMAFGEEDVSEFAFAEPIVTESRAAVEYWAVLLTGGREQTLSGVTLLLFDADGMVTEHRDIWMMAEGRHPRPAGFVPVQK